MASPVEWCLIVDGLFSDLSNINFWTYKIKPKHALQFDLLTDSPEEDQDNKTYKLIIENMRK